MLKVSGRRPQNLGATDGRLAPCPRKPNCVSSQATDRKHAVEPIRFSGDPTAAMSKLREVVEGMQGKVVEAEGDYLYAEFSSRIFGFVDDFELLCDREAGVVHVRSASRVGYGDLGVNRRRVEEVRRRFGAAG